MHIISFDQTIRNCVGFSGNLSFTLKTPGILSAGRNVSARQITHLSIEVFVLALSCGQSIHLNFPPNILGCKYKLNYLYILKFIFKRLIAPNSKSIKWFGDSTTIHFAPQCPPNPQVSDFKLHCLQGFFFSTHY
jgi:hypothetical protein